MATAFTVEIDWDHDGTWTDETGRARRIQIRSGFDEAGDRVAGVGRCILTVDNRDSRFSPGYASGPLYGKLLPRREVRITASDGESSWVLFRGFIERLLPEAGQWGGGASVIECVDGVPLLAQQRIGVPHSASKAVDEAVAEVVSFAYIPAGTSYADNGDSLEHYGRAWKPEATTCLEALRDICDAVYGRFFVARDGTATCLSRGDLQNPSAAAALAVDETSPLEDLEVALAVDRVINLAEITVYPVETVGAAQIIWTARTVLHLAPGQTRVIHAPFRDDNGERCGAVEVVAPVATTDYLVNDQPGGDGFNYTNSPHFSVSTAIEATRATITLSNTAIGPLYVTKLQVRGKPIRVYDPITIEEEDAASQNLYEKRALALDLWMMPDPVFGQAYAEYLVGRYKAPALAATRMEVRDRDVIAGVNLFSLEMMDKILASDPATGLSEAAHWIRAVEYDLQPGGYVVTLHLERADDRKYCLLDRQEFAELGTNSRLGF
ncbi:MAG TPA: hypothetical protein VMT24_08555 [Aggregatilineaceae bacterium]|nr:hypothetical protein [Aggregatilineaceae bacterium]